MNPLFASRLDKLKVPPPRLFLLNSEFFSSRLEKLWMMAVKVKLTIGRAIPEVQNADPTISL